MRKVSKWSKRISFFLAVIMVLFSNLGSLKVNAYDEEYHSERMNVVFLLDSSGSVKTSDEDKLRFEAMELFLGLAAEQGNYMGAVVFSHKLIAEEDIRAINSIADKNALVDAVRDSTIQGYTDIGMALDAAVNMIETKGNKSLNSAIIFLTDGHTELKPGDDLEPSLELKQEAIERARNAGIKVYGVCLNADGYASYEEVREISNATGGESLEIKTASDLKDVFEMFYGIIFDTNTIPIPVPEPDANGDLNIDFEIPGIGVEEANIIINTLNPNVSFELKKPSGIGLTDSELNKMVIKAKSFIVVKIPYPDEGLWKLTIRGVTRDEVEINMMYNGELGLELRTVGNVSSIHVHDSVAINSFIYSNNKLITDPEPYQKYPTYLEITDANGKVNTGKMATGSSAASINCTFDTVGEYDLVSYIDIDGKKRYSNAQHISVINSAPEAEDLYGKKTILFDNSPLEFNLYDYASDLEDEQLTFRISDTDLDEDYINLSDGILTVDAVRSGPGEIELVVIDSAGDEAHFTATIETLNLLIFVYIGLGLLVLIGLIIWICKLNKKRNRRVQGDLEVEVFNAEGDREIETIRGDRGIINIGKKSMNLENVRNTGINLRDCTLRAGQSDSSAVFTSKKILYTEDGQGLKKIDLYDGNYTKLYADSQDTESGIILCYKMDNENYSGSSFNEW